MSRRCKPGQRARVIHNGAIVMVVGHYFHGVEWGGSTNWHTEFYPWKTVSLGAPLEIFSMKTGKFMRMSMYCVHEDADLEPLDDGDDGLTRATEKDKPNKKPKPAKVDKPVGTTS